MSLGFGCFLFEGFVGFVLRALLGLSWGFVGFVMRVLLVLSREIFVVFFHGVLVGCVMRALLVLS